VGIVISPKDAQKMHGLVILIHNYRMIILNSFNNLYALLDVLFLFFGCCCCLLLLLFVVVICCCYLLLLFVVVVVRYCSYLLLFYYFLLLFFYLLLLIFLFLIRRPSLNESLLNAVQSFITNDRDKHFGPNSPLPGSSVPSSSASFSSPAGAGGGGGGVDPLGFSSFYSSRLSSSSSFSSPLNPNNVAELLSTYIHHLLLGDIQRVHYSTSRKKNFLTSNNNNNNNNNDGGGGGGSDGRKLVAFDDDDYVMDLIKNDFVLLFRAVETKDVFEAFYKKDLGLFCFFLFFSFFLSFFLLLLLLLLLLSLSFLLSFSAAKRLFNSSDSSISITSSSSSFDTDKEKMVLTQLKSECGASFTKNMELMFSDVQSSRELCDQFKDVCFFLFFFVVTIFFFFFFFFLY
jgi:hypothetical protein